VIETRNYNQDPEFDNVVDRKGRGIIILLQYDNSGTKRRHKGAFVTTFSPTIILINVFW
jgi:hypothetical protein